MPNPFLDPAFDIKWSRLTPGHIAPDIQLALDRARARVDAIASLDPAAVTFENTFLALEDATEELGVAWGKVSTLQSVADSPALRQAHNEMLPKVSAFYAGIPLNGALWERLKAFERSPAAEGLTGVRRRLLTETAADFRQAGADLPADKRARLEAVQTELAGVTQKFSENVLDATNSWELVVTDEARLAGLPAQAREAARRSAAGKDLGTDEKPAWRFSLHQPSLEPVLIYAEDASLRREVWSAAAALGSAAPHDNTGLIGRILGLRAEKSALLGKPDFADAILERRMAKSGARAMEFVEDIQSRCAAAFSRECRELEEHRASAVAAAPGAHPAPWEVAYWAEKLRRSRYDFDEEALRPYFPIDRVLAGLFELAGRVFGIRVAERPAGEVETWHPEVRFYDVHDARDRHIGSFYADWHPRESKRGGAWMSGLITGGPRPDGSRAPHLGMICGNMTPPAPGRPALIKHREAETIFHEFGHLLHHLLGEVPIKSLSGTSVAWDFVELPSQIMENWCWERESLDLFARHHETGAAIPEEMFKRMTAAKNFRAACAAMRQVSFAKMDLALHRRAAEFAKMADIEPGARAAIADCLVPTEPPAPTIAKRFTHIFGDPVGYAAGYYSYKWAEVLEADAFTRFRREGLFSRRVGAEFVEKILSRGNSADPAELFRDFMGRDPDIQALLIRSGLAA